MTVQIDIEMPIYCYDCPCHNGENGRCNITGDSTFDKRPFDCPLKEVKLADLPSVKQKGGKWKTEWHDFFHVKLPVCSYCLEFSPFKYDYCPRCGAKMDEEKTDETN